MAKKSSGQPAVAPDATEGLATVPTRSSRRATPPASGKPGAAPPAAAEADLLRERMRGWLALAFVAPLASVVPIVLLGLLVGKLSVGDVKELVAAFGLTQLVALAMRFYFGRVTK
jgi:hypothetical protein